MKNVADRILDAIGDKAMARLCQEFGGSVVYVPHHSPDGERDDNILQLFSDALKEGASNMTAYGNAATTHGVSVRTVQRIVARS